MSEAADRYDGRPPRLSARRLTVGYTAGGARRAVLTDLDLRVDAGELVCVLGRNGSGKSTLLRALAGLAPPLAGEIRLVGDPLAGLGAHERARRLGVVLPEAVHTGLLRGAELVALGRHPHTGWTGRLGDDDRAAVARALRQVGAEALASRRVAELSDGERQRILIARALAQEPEVLILDEPTAFLDLPTRAEVLALLLRLAHQHPRRAVLLSTHDLDLALRHADRLWLLDDGGLRDGCPEDLVLDGGLERAFGRPGLTFDAETGALRATAASSRAVVLRGSGLAAHWTRRALERVGCAVLGAAAAGDDVPVVTVEEDAGETRWRLGRAGDEEAFRRIAPLLSAVAARAPAAGSPGGSLL